MQPIERHFNPQTEAHFQLVTSSELGRFPWPLSGWAESWQLPCLTTVSCQGK